MNRVKQKVQNTRLSQHCTKNKSTKANENLAVIITKTLLIINCTYSSRSFCYIYEITYAIRADKLPHYVKYFSGFS